jgi:hypothetical protein
MKPSLVLASVLMLLVCSGCGDSHEAVMNDQMSLTKDMLAIMQGIKDEASASAAKPKMQALAEKAKAIEERQKNLGKPSDAEVKQLQAKYGTEMEALMSKVMGEVIRISSIPGAAQQLQDMTRSMSKMN